MPDNSIKYKTVREAAEHVGKLYHQLEREGSTRRHTLTFEECPIATCANLRAALNAEKQAEAGGEIPFRLPLRIDVMGNVFDADAHWICGNGFPEDQGRMKYLVSLCNRSQATPDAPRLEDWLVRQEEWSSRTFGHGLRTGGITEHIEKELAEIKDNPHDLSEWVDVILLALDGYWRHGGNPREIMQHLIAKWEKNFAREWPKPIDEDHAVEHVRKPTPDPEVVKRLEDDPSRCAVCGWPLAAAMEAGCVRGDCSMRPLPKTFYNEARALAERAIKE